MTADESADRVEELPARYTEGLTDLRIPGEPSKVRSRVLTGTGRIALGKRKAP